MLEVHLSRLEGRLENRGCSLSAGEGGAAQDESEARGRAVKAGRAHLGEKPPRKSEQAGGAMRGDLRASERQEGDRVAGLVEVAGLASRRARACPQSMSSTVGEFDVSPCPRCLPPEGKGSGG